MHIDEFFFKFIFNQFNWFTTRNSELLTCLGVINPNKYRFENIWVGGGLASKNKSILIQHLCMHVPWPITNVKYDIQIWHSWACNCYFKEMISIHDIVDYMWRCVRKCMWYGVVRHMTIFICLEYMLIYYCCLAYV